VRDLVLAEGGDVVELLLTTQHVAPVRATAQHLLVHLGVLPLVQEALLQRETLPPLGVAAFEGVGRDLQAVLRLVRL